MTRDEFDNLLKRAGLNKKKFSELTEVSYSTITQWGTYKNGKPLPVPKWVKSWISYYIKSKNWDDMTKKILELEV